jgi:hypothetical protein
MSLALTVSIIFVIFIIVMPTNDVLLLLTTITTNNCHSCQTTTMTAYAQPTTSKTQTWIDKQNNIKIQFTYQPENPVVNTPTELKFTIQNLKTGEYLKNLFARVVITNGQRSFKFTNIAIPTDGNFSVKYLFPDSGAYQIITRIDDLENDSNNNNYRFSTLSSFQVFVPLQISSSTNNISIIIIATAAIVAAIVFVSIQFILKKRKKETKYGLH